MVATIVLSALVWVVGQDLGGVLAPGVTDVGSGPLLILVALAYWPMDGPAGRGAGRAAWRARRGGDVVPGGRGPAGGGPAGGRR